MYRHLIPQRRTGCIIGDIEIDHGVKHGVHAGHALLVGLEVHPAVIVPAGDKTQQACPQADALAIVFLQVPQCAVGLLAGVLSSGARLALICSSSFSSSPAVNVLLLMLRIAGFNSLSRLATGPTSWPMESRRAEKCVLCHRGANIASWADRAYNCGRRVFYAPIEQGK
ncbi:hypothetical protein [Duganella sp.]|uniref:hypothetical protein n=1 Tax=Duganella sp. TaxID=1904440 RepID=UPI0031DBE165